MEHLKSKTGTRFKKNGDILSEDTQLTIKIYKLDKVYFYQGKTPLKFKES